jgi:fumarate reductase subunit D
LLLKLEPVIWLLFGGGIMVGTMLMTAWVAVVGVAIPLGLVSGDALAFERAYHLGSSLIGRVVLAALIAMPLWKGAHHTRHLLLDAGGASRDVAMASLLYLLALGGSLMAIVAVVRL